MFYYLRLMPLGLVISCVPLLFFLPQWRREGALGTGIGIAVVYGLVVPMAIWLSYGVVYGTSTLLLQRTGRMLQLPTLIYMLINFLGLCLGIWGAMFTVHLLFDRPMGGGSFVASMAFGSLVMLFFAMHFAYRNAKEEALALRASVAEAKYHALENQMRPHFLFNALNSLAELIEIGQPNAAETTYRLSELYRKILANSAVKTATLSSELEIVRAYLEIEQLRFGARLRYEIKVAVQPDSVYLPSLMLQTLVENALKHGITPAVSGGELIVAVARSANGLLRAEVANTGCPLKPPVVDGGVGVANTQARLALLYGEQHQFRLETDPQGRTLASFFFTGERLD